LVAVGRCLDKNDAIDRPEATRPSEERQNPLRVLLGATVGVGKTVAMLREGHRLRSEGADVVVALVETHGRPATEAGVGDLEVLPRRPIPYRGVVWQELDLDGVIARKPDVALIDELAHRNPPTSRHQDRWEDVRDILDAGIRVITTINIRQLRSVAEIAAGITGTPPRAVVPDEFVRSGDVELIDVSPEVLRQRVAAGLIVPQERIDAALSYAFRADHIGALRELALLWLAGRVEDELDDYLARHGIARLPVGRERILVAVSESGSSAHVIDRAVQIAKRMLAAIQGVHVIPDDGLVRSTSRTLDGHRTRLEANGGELTIVRADSVADRLASAAGRFRATQLVIGAPARRNLVSVASGSAVALLRRGLDCDMHLVARNAGAGGG
jgi:two-component system sensor histidine kinase KdpD